MNLKTIAIIPAAGTGTRIKSDIKKQYLLLDDKPILVHTLQAIVRAELVDEIIVVVAPGEQQYCIDRVIEPYNFQISFPRFDFRNKFPRFDFRNKIKLAEGGKTRQESVFNGLKSVPKDCKVVLIHDGVRPFVEKRLIEDLLTAAEQFGAATAAVPVKDTIKVVDENCFVVDTPPRKDLWAIQTPQTFRYEIIIEAHQKAQNKIKATDDATLVEKLGYKVKIVRGSYRNIKITTPDDLEFARFVVREK